jgi:hypothetical protein
VVAFDRAGVKCWKRDTREAEHKSGVALVSTGEYAYPAAFLGLRGRRDRLAGAQSDADMEHVHIGAGNGIPVLGETASPPLPIHTPADLGDDVQVQRMSSSSVGTALSLTNPATAMKDTVASSVRSRVTPNQAWHGRPSPDKLF